MSEESDLSIQCLLARPPYNWWDAHPPYISPPHPSNESSTSTSTTTPRPTLPSSPIINFLHPAYDFPANILFSLPAVDNPVGSSLPGVHHGTALSACMIITANRHGRLTTSVTPPTLTDLTSPTFLWDTVLTEPRYYFHPTEANHPSAPPYPVVPDFRSWRFPHGQLLPEWVDPEYKAPPAASSTYMSGKVLDRDGFCRVTGSSAGLHCSHVIPRCELDWFRLNTMSVYNANTILSQAHAIDDTTNGFALRSDLNGPGFDAGRLVVAPKEGKLVLHFLFDVSELGYLYHNRELHPIPTIPREFLFARFAWSIFPLLGRFLNAEKNLSISRNTKSVWTVTEEFGRWTEAKKSEKGSKRRRPGDRGEANGSGSAGAPGVVDGMDFVFKDEADSFVDDDDDHWSSLSEHETGDEFSLSEPDSVISVRSDRIIGPAALPEQNAREEHDMAPTGAAPPDHSTSQEASDPTIASPLLQLFVSPRDELPLDQREMAEDYAIAQEVFPDMLKGGVVNRDIAFYPGHRQIERVKRRLRRDRRWVASLAECRDSNGHDGGDAKRRRVDGQRDSSRTV